jgi:putative peptide zinc metalloprotease protein
MEKDIEELIVPVVSPAIEISSFGDRDYLIKHRTFHYQVKVNGATMEMLNLVNGHRTIGEITEVLSTKLNTKITSSTVYDKLYKGNLSNFGIIQTGKEISPKKAYEYIWAKFVIFKPEQIAGLTRLLSYFFQPGIFYTLLSLSLIYIISIFIFFNDLKTVFERFVQPENILVFYITLLMSVFFHEMGHASACRKFGAKHGDIGFGFYLVLPVFYTDVSDAWRLPRHQRFIIDMAGIYMELLLYVLIVSLFFVTANTFFLQLVFIRVIGTLLNLNPLLRYDGYWALSDLMNVPNLRTTANKKLLRSMNWILGKSTFPLTNLIDYFLALYALVSWSFVIVFLMTILFWQVDSILYFPMRLYEFCAQSFSNLSIRTFQILLNRFSVPLLFYYMLSRWLYGRFRSFQKSRLYLNTINSHAK